MRPHLIVLLCTTGAACGFISPVFGQTSSPLEFSLDLLAPCSATTCSGTHPTDAGFQLQANSFSYASPSSSYGVATLGLTAPMVCDEISSSGTVGPVGATRMAPHFANSTLSGGALDFNAGGDSIVDLNSLSFDGGTPAGVTTLYGNYSAPSLPPQVTCYNINPVTGGARSDAPGPADTVFHTSFDDHYGNEPWVSVQTINSPHATTSAPAGISGTTTPDQMDYVVQIHNASSATNWRLTLGYDDAYFSTAASGTSPSACVLGSPQPGSTGTCSSNYISLPYTLRAADVQTATNSIYIQVTYTGSNAAVTNWSALTGAFYPAVAAVFPPFGIYPQRFDDKTAVATANNVPQINITDIVCNNDMTSTSCQVYGPEAGTNGGRLPASIVNTNTITSDGTLTVDPVAYLVNPYSGNTFPGNTAADVLAKQVITCSNPNDNMFAGGTGLTVSDSGSIQYNAVFKKSGGVYVPGTTTCTVIYYTPLSGYSPRLSSTQVFSITMLPTAATHLVVSAPQGATAGTATNATVSALDAGNNPVPTYNGIMHFTSSDGAAVLPANGTLSGGTGTFPITFKTAGAQTITATDTVSQSISGISGSVAVAAGAASTLQVQALSPQTHGQQFQISVAARDAYGNTATGYSGTVHFTSTDGAAVLPANQTLASGVASPLPFVTLNTIGSQTVTATDTTNSSVTGVSNSITVN